MRAPADFDPAAVTGKDKKWGEKDIELLGVPGSLSNIQECSLNWQGIRRTTLSAGKSTRMRSAGREELYVKKGVLRAT